jgi:UDP-glucose 4-epimerase
MRTLVTGGAGFIGSNLVDALLDGGHEVLVLDNLSTGRAANLSGALTRGAQLETVDITDAAEVEAHVAGQRPEAIFHLAAQIDVRKSVTDPAFDARVNVEGTINVLEAARRAEVGRVVFSSTGGAIYGETERLPSPEDVEPRPKAPYGQSKFCAERYLDLYTRLFGLSTVALRYGNVYGPRQDPMGEAGVVAIFCGKLLAGEPATIFGDGGQTRDYVYVGDVVAANLAAATSDAAGEINIGVGREVSVLDLVEVLRELSGEAGFEVVHAPERPGEVARSCLDVSRAAQLLGWGPQTDLREGMRRALEHTRSEAVGQGAERESA